MIRRPPRSPPFPSTPLFRSLLGAAARAADRARRIAELRTRLGELAAEHARLTADLTETGELLGALDAAADRLRSEEHTSELQSHLNLVCRLLLEKKKTLRTR